MPDDGKDKRISAHSIVRRDTIRAASPRGSRKLHNKRNGTTAAAARVVTEPGQQHHGDDGQRRESSGPASVFVAYAREDSAEVGKLIARLRRNGAAVTWDQDFAAGVNVRQTIKSAIEGASAVIVVWSEAAAQSLFVMDEADWALRKNKLVPTHVAGFDPQQVPVGFGQIQTVPLDVPGPVENSLKALGVVLN